MRASSRAGARLRTGASSISASPAKPSRGLPAPEGRSVRYAIAGKGDPTGLAGGLAEALERAGFTPAGADNGASLVINVVDPADPKPFRRHSRGTFVAALWSSPKLPE